MSESTEQFWVDKSNEHLKGKVVHSVRYLTKEEAEDMGWYNRPIVIIFTDSTWILPSQDDEGNDGGAIFGHSPTNGEFTLPVIR